MRRLSSQCSRLFLYGPSRVTKVAREAGEQMITDHEELIAALVDGELREHTTENVELKRSWTQSNGKKLSMLANRTGQPTGWLAVGVEDDGRLSGHDEAWLKRTEEQASQHLNQYLEPAQACDRILRIVHPEGCALVLRVVSPGAVVRWNQKAYKGSGSTIAEMTPAEVMQLQVSLPGLTDYSAQRTSSDVTDELVARFAAALAHRAEEPDLAEASALEPQVLLGRLRIAGTQTSRLLFGGTRYRLVVMDSDGEVRRNQSGRGLFQLLTPEFREELQKIAQSLSGLGQAYPDRALREGLANAVAHAAYFERDGDIIVEIHPDHLTISNLCLAESVHFANKWFSRSHSTVNTLLMETLRLAGTVDELGRGKSLIMAESLRGGHPPPVVLTESAGRFQRWKLMLHGGGGDARFLKLLKRLRDVYQDEKQALLANAVVHWRDQPLSSLRRYIDDESKPLFAAVLAKPDSPILLDEENDAIAVRRWVSVLLEEGQDSKTLSEAEEKAVLDSLRAQTEGTGGIFRNVDLRRAAGMGSSRSEQAMSSALLSRWRDTGTVRKLGHGKYQLVEIRSQQPRSRWLEQIMTVLTEVESSWPTMEPITFRDFTSHTSHHRRLRRPEQEQLPLGRAAGGDDVIDAEFEESLGGDDVIDAEFEE